MCGEGEGGRMREVNSEKAAEVRGSGVSITTGLITHVEELGLYLQAQPRL